MSANRNEMVKVPGSLDLVERAELGINGLMGTLDPAVDYEPYFLVFTNSRPAYMVHWSSMVSGVLPKYVEAMALLRNMTGSTHHADIEGGMIHSILANTAEDGLIYDRVDPRRPWNVGVGYGKKSWNEDYANIAGNGRLACGMDWYHQLTGDPVWLKAMERACVRIAELAVHKDNFAYYPNVGCGNDFSWPRTSGWVHTDEPQGPQEGGEGVSAFYLALPIRGMVRWYKRSGDERMLDTSRRLARFVMKPKFWGGAVELDPSYGPARAHWWGHFHGNLAALRGVLEYGLAAEDWRAMEFVRDGYEWARHHRDPRFGFDAGMEGCCAGDLTALGIQLSEAGIGDYWDDVDHVVRNFLSTAQVTDPEILRRVGEASAERPKDADWGAQGDWRFGHGMLRKPQPGQESTERTIERSIGCFTWLVQAGRWQNPVLMQCCTGNGNQGFYYAWDAIVRHDAGTATVNLLLNRFSPWLDVASYLPFEGKVVIANRTCRRIGVRIPRWVKRSLMALTVDGARVEPTWVGSLAMVDGLKPGAMIKITFPLETEKVTVALPSVNARAFRGAPTVTGYFRGSTCVGLEPAEEAVNGADPVLYPLFGSPELQKTRAPMKEVERRVVERPIRWY
jgi:hypothetical protein